MKRIASTIVSLVMAVFIAMASFGLGSLNLVAFAKR